MEIEITLINRCIEENAIFTMTLHLLSSFSVKDAVGPSPKTKTQWKI